MCVKSKRVRCKGLWTGIAKMVRTARLTCLLMVMLSRNANAMEGLSSLAHRDVSSRNGKGSTGRGEELHAHSGGRTGRSSRDPLGSKVCVILGHMPSSPAHSNTQLAHSL